MEASNAFSATLLELARIPFSPFIELSHVFDGLKFREAVAVGSGDLFQRRVIEFNSSLDALFRDRDVLIEQLRRGEGLQLGPSKLRMLASSYRTLGNSYRQALAQDPILVQEVTQITQNAALELEDIANVLESENTNESSNRQNASHPIPDPKLLTAMDRLGFQLDEWDNINSKAVIQRYRERVKLFHPDITRAEDEAGKAFFEEQTKKLTEARDYLLQILESVK